MYNVMTINIINRVMLYYPDFEGAIVAVDLKGNYGAACHGFAEFTYSVASEILGGAKVFSMKCK